MKTRWLQKNAFGDNVTMVETSHTNSSPNLNQKSLCAVNSQGNTSSEFLTVLSLTLTLILPPSPISVPLTTLTWIPLRSPSGWSTPWSQVPGPIPILTAESGTSHARGGLGQTVCLSCIRTLTKPLLTLKSLPWG